jgi:hypothetical protein
LLFTIPATGKTYSACVWSNGADSFLPQTERIKFLINPDTKETVTIPWKAAMSLVSDLIEEDPELRPRRFRVRSFPSEEQISKLRELLKTDTERVS